MNKIMKKMKIKGYETNTIIQPRKDRSSKEVVGVQLALDIEEIISTNKNKEN